MKNLKLMIVALVAAGAISGLATASSAYGTVLCKVTPVEGGSTKGTVCLSGEAYPSGTELHAILDPGTGPGRLTTSFKTVECKRTTVAGTTENEGSASETVKGKATTITLEECNCETKVIKTGTLEIHWIADSFNGTLTASGTEITSSCNTIFGSVHCIYAMNGTDSGTLTGGSPATVDVESVDIPRLTTNFLCDESANWDAKYEVTSPAPLYVASHT